MEKESAQSKSVDEIEIRRQLARLIKQVFGLAKQIHGDRVMNNNELKAEIHADIERMRIAKPRMSADGRRQVISVMTLGQLKELVYEYEQMLGRRPYWKKGSRGQGKPTAGVTELQNRFIVDLFNELGYDARGRSHFCEHVVKTFWPQTRGQANAVIEGLKAVKRKRGIVVSS